MRLYFDLKYPLITSECTENLGNWYTISFDTHESFCGTESEGTQTAFNIIQQNASCEKICYDKAGNLPNKGRNFNTQTWGKIVYFLFVWLVGIGFRQNFFRVLPNFGDFVAKMSFFHYIINQNRNNFIKHCSPPVYQEAADIRDVYLYKKFAV